MKTTERDSLLIDSNKGKGPEESKCTTRNIIILSIVLVVLLAIGLILGLAVDWEDDESPSRSDEYWEDEYLKLPTNESCFEMSSDLASQPHVAGTIEQLQTGYYVVEKLEEFGFDNIIQQNWSNTVLDHFVSSEIRINVNNTGFIPLSIHEQILETDPDTDSEYRFHIWSAYAKTGNVTANLIYINYGLRANYEYLIENENYTDITSNQSYVGFIGFVRFGGGIGRAGKVKIAQSYGLIGLIIFSDPEQYAPDGEISVYPNGPWLPESGVQRGSIKYASCPGNPEINRLNDLCGIDNIEDAIPTIPVIPMSRYNAKLLFENMDDSDAEYAPNSWYGLMDTEYIITSPNLVVNLNIVNDLHQNDVIQNVYGIIKGDKYPDQSIMVGAHRDSWVYGAQDDVSGTATVMEVAKGFGEIYKRGWRPKRTMIFASWDGEESGLIGSCSLGESQEEEDLELTDGLIAYLNLDMTTGGNVFDVSGHPLLQKVSVEAMKRTPYFNKDDETNMGNETDLTFYDIWGGNWGTLGQGSDHTVFAFHLGVAAMDFGFGGPGSFGSYHSLYDTIAWQQTVDPNYKFAENIAKYAGILSMKLLNAEIIPFNLSYFTETMTSWFENNLVTAALTTYNCNPNNLTSTLLNELSDSIEEFTENANMLNDIIWSGDNDENGEDDEDIDDELIEQYNDVLGSISRELIYEDGLPGRTWHKNILWNTAFESG
eukprot:221992_1